ENVNGLAIYDFAELAKMQSDGSELKLVLENGQEMVIDQALQKGDNLKVVQVLNGSPAEVAGLKEGVELLKINGVAVNDYQKLAEVLAVSKDKVVYTIKDQGEEKDIEM